MVFEIVEKNSGVKGLGDNEISVGKTGCFFGSDVARGFNGFSRCEVYLDYDDRQVGFKPTNDGTTGFVLGKAKDGLQRKSLSGSWVKQISKGRYIANKNNDGIFVINVREIARKHELINKNGELNIKQV